MSAPEPEPHGTFVAQASLRAGEPRGSYEVGHCPPDEAMSLADPGSDGADPVAVVRRGLPFGALDNLVRAIGVSRKEVASVIGMPQTTLGRRRQSGTLTSAESDQVLRVARLVAMTRSLMADDAEAARRWLTTPHRLLGDETPLRRASTEVGGREVEQLIGQLRYGVFS